MAVPLVQSKASHFVTSSAGVKIPKMIYGTAWKKERTADLVVEAVKTGFKGIDVACQPKHYNEPGVGKALVRLAAEGIGRETLFLQTKFTSVSGQDPSSIPYDPEAPLKSQVEQSLSVSLKNLGTDIIDSLVLHGPLRTHESTMEVWRTFESFVDDGKVRQLGMSNCYDLSAFKKIYSEARIKPAVLQNRFHSETNFDVELRAFCAENHIFYQSFWTLSANPKILRNSDVVQLAKNREKTPEQMFFAYLLSTGIITPLTGTTNKTHMQQDLEAMDIIISEEEAKIFEKLLKI